jgi:hypothetical protein
MRLLQKTYGPGSPIGRGYRPCNAGWPLATSQTGWPCSPILAVCSTMPLHCNSDPTSRDAPRTYLESAELGHYNRAQRIGNSRLKYPRRTGLERPNLRGPPLYRPDPRLPCSPFYGAATLKKKGEGEGRGREPRGREPRAKGARAKGQGSGPPAMLRCNMNARNVPESPVSRKRDSQAPDTKKGHPEGWPCSVAAGLARLARCNDPIMPALA